MNDGGNPPTDTQVRIELNVVATSGLIHLGETPLSAQELRFLQDLASALHWARTRKRLDERLRNSQLLWPIVEVTGTPQRAITVFCQKHHLFSDETAVLITPGAQAVSRPGLTMRLPTGSASRPSTRPQERGCQTCVMAAGDAELARC